MDKIRFPAIDSSATSISKDTIGNDETPEALTGVSEILWKAQEDIKQMKEEILKEAGSDEKACERLKGIIEKVEDNIKRQTEDMVKSVNNQCAVVPEAKPTRNLPSKRALHNVTSNAGPLVARSKDLRKPGPGVLPPGQQFMNLQKLKAIINPLSQDTRKLLNEKYSVPLPPTKGRRVDSVDEDFQDSLDASNKPRLKTKSLAAPDLTRGAMKEFTDPPQLTDGDVKQGVRYLIERKFIPACAKITFEPPPVHSKQLTLYPHSQNEKQAGAQFNEENKDDDEAKLEPSGTADSRNTRQEEPRQSRITFRDQPDVKKSNFQFGNTTEQRDLSVVTDTSSMKGSQALVPFSTPTFDDGTLVHRFMIQSGKARINSQDFIQFKEFYQSAWGSIVSLLKKMEKFLTNYSVPVAIIHGDQLADLAMYFEGNLAPTIEDMLTCILNRDDVGRIMMIPGRRYIAPDGRKEAATKIQSCYRRFKDRNTYLLYRKRKWAAGLLAMNWIMICKVSLIRKQLKLARAGHLERYRVRLKNLRPSWDKLQSSRRVVIHIPSLGYAQHVRSSLHDIDDRQNRQVGRIFEASDPNVDIIYVWPWKFSEDTEKYYMRLLDLSDKIDENDEPPSRRCTLVSPESSHRFPSHNMCVSTLLKYSPRALNRIKSLIKGKSAYIVPGLMHNDDLFVADFLDVPILGSEPEIAALYSSKSGARRIFEDAKIDRGPSDTDLYTATQLHESLAELTTSHLDIKRWLFKIDDQIDGRGIAYCDLVSHLTCYDWVQKEAARYGEKWNKKWARETAYTKILAEIPTILEKHTVVADKKKFSSWSDYLNEYLSKGGIIEACPPSDSITTVSLDVLIEPNGKTKIIAAADQINGVTRYKCLGYTFPQLSVEPSILQSITQDISSSCKNRGIVGYITINMVTFIDPISLKQRVWPVGLDLSYSMSNSSLQILRHITKGQLNFENSSYTVPVLTKGMRPLHRKGRKKPTQKNEEKCNPELRYAIFSNVLRHESLRSVQSSVLFQLCKSHGIGFDIKAKLGTVFTIIDQLHKESFGIITVGASMQEAISSFALNLSLIHRDISTHEKVSNSNLQGIINSIQLILDVSSVNEDPQAAIPYTPCNPKSETGVSSHKSGEIASKENGTLPSTSDAGNPCPSLVTDHTTSH